MKYFLTFLFIELLSICCTSENNKESGHGMVYATIVGAVNVYGNIRHLAVIESAPEDCNFLCKDALPANATGYYCGNAVMITNLPADMSLPGTRISFSSWNDYGADNRLEDSLVAHQVGIFDMEMIAPPTKSNTDILHKNVDHEVYYPHCTCDPHSHGLQKGQLHTPNCKGNDYGTKHIQ